MIIKPEDFFKSLADSTRLRCLVLIQQEGELCVCELAYALKMVQPKISRHLALLRKFNIVQDRRNGLWIYYRLHPDLPKWMSQTLKAAVKAINEIAPFQVDVQRLATMADRPSCCT